MPDDKRCKESILAIYDWMLLFISVIVAIFICFLLPVSRLGTLHTVMLPYYSVILMEIRCQLRGRGAESL